MRIQVTLVIEMTDAQVRDYAADYGVPLANGGKPYAKDVVADVRNYVLCAVQNSPAFYGADVTVKG